MTQTATPSLTPTVTGTIPNEGTPTTPTPTGTIPAEGTPTTPTPTQPSATSTPRTSNNNNSNSNNNNSNSNNNNDNRSDDGGNDNIQIITRRINDNNSSGGAVGNVPGFNYPGVLAAQPNTPTPGVLSIVPRPQPAVAGQQPAQVPPVAGQAPRPIQTPSVLPVAGQLGADLPRLAALAGIGLVAGGLGLRLRERLFGGRRAADPPAAAPEYEGDVADTYMDDRM